MINCHMANQIQFQKVGNDIPRTPGKTQDLSLFPGKKRQVPSLPPPQPFPILTIPSRINTISISFPPPGTELQLDNFCSCGRCRPAVNNPMLGCPPAPARAGSSFCFTSALSGWWDRRRKFTRKTVPRAKELLPWTRPDRMY